MTAAPETDSFRTGPDERGRFGIFGGRFVAETLMPLILDLEKAYEEAKADPSFAADMESYRTHYIGRPARSTTPSGSPSTCAARRRRGRGPSSISSVRS